MNNDEDFYEEDYGSYEGEENEHSLEEDAFLVGLFIDSFNENLQSAQEGDADAQYQTALNYQDGNFVQINDEESFKWFKKASEQGHSEAQYSLGACYYFGQGTEKNITEAIKWYKESARQGNGRAKEFLSHILLPTCLFFDTETTGLPLNYNAPSSDLNNWPRLVQLSWILTDKEGYEIKEGDYIIYPNGFEIPSDSSDIHGITTEKARREGKPIEEVLKCFLQDFDKVKYIVGHNVEFDKKIVGAELIRLGQRDIMDSKTTIDTMLTTIDYCAIEGYYGYKYPKLQELHKKLFGHEFDDAHNSLADVRATERCFWELVKRRII